MARILLSLDKDVMLYNASGFPAFLAWLEPPCPVWTRIAELPRRPDLLVSLDCSVSARLGEDLRPLLAVTPVVNIDHHQAHPDFDTLYNWVEPERSAAGEMAALLADGLGVPLRGKLAEAVYAALVADTGCFSFDSTTPEAMRLAARLMENGVNASLVRDSLENVWSEGTMRLWGKLLQETRLLEEGRLAVAVACRGLFENGEAAGEDLEGFVEHLRRVRGVRVAFLLKETTENGTAATRISLRSRGGDDVRAVAAQFGGGGHKNAAGATLPLPPARALAAVLPCIRRIWEERPVP
jgi:phosphoesterase RecJ-like protein